jgi:hypothetical protein
LLRKWEEKCGMGIMKQCKNYKCQYHDDSGSGCDCDRIEIGSDGKCLDCYVKDCVEEEINFTEFMNYCKSGTIKCDKQLLGLLDVFGEEVYANYYDLLLHQVLRPVGYELVIKKKEVWD